MTVTELVRLGIDIKDINHNQTDLQILKSNKNDLILDKLILNKLLHNRVTHLSNIEGQSWYGKYFYEFPFCFSGLR